MDWTQTLFDVIDFGSFSSLWYWIVLAVVWSTASHWVLGVPYDMVLRAERSKAGALSDLEELVRINVGRLLYIAHESGLWLAGFTTFGLTGLGVLGFWYGVEFAQALFLIALPFSGLGVLALNTATRIRAEGLGGAALCKLLHRHRVWTQVIGVAAIFVTAMYGMWQNLEVLQAI